MSEIEKIKRYIELTNANISERYDLGLLEMNALKGEKDVVDAVYLSFLYGRAKV